MRARIIYSKGSALKFTGALDIQAIWQRSLKRAGLTVELSQGFHPQPKIQLPFPLPLGFTGQNEIIDIWFAQDYELEDVRGKLTGSLPVGIEIQCIELINGQKKSVASSATYADFKVIVDTTDVDITELKFSIEKLLESQTIMRERNDKLYDLRPLILSIQIENEIDEKCVLEMRLSAHPSTTGRPDEVMKELGVNITDCEIERLGVQFEN